MAYVITEPCIGVKYTADAVKRRIAVTSTAFSLLQDIRTTLD